MRIVMITDRTDAPDEGMKGTASRLYSEVSRTNDVRCVTPREVLSLSFVNEVRRNKPDIIHYFPGPTVRSFLVLKIAKSIAGSFSVTSATHPRLPRRGLKTIHFLWPDLVLCQSNNTRNRLSRMGFKTETLWSGVDSVKFTPVDKERKTKLRRSHGIEEDSFVALHVGHMNSRRNLEEMIPLARIPGVTVLIIASSSSTPDLGLRKRLQDAGCIIKSDYMRNIEDVYRMADCYVFPTSDPQGCIELPLSILEALACNLPVITTRFGAIPDLFSNKEGVVFFSSPDELIEGLERIRTRDSSWNTRPHVLDLDWKQIGNRLDELYRKHLPVKGAR